VQRVTVTKDEKSASFNVEVMSLTSIVIEKPPTKTTYIVGEPLDLTGIMVTGNYTGADPLKKKSELIPVDKLTVDGYDPNRVGNQQAVRITVRGQTANFFVNVEAAPPQTTTTTTTTTSTGGSGGGNRGQSGRTPTQQTPTVTGVTVSPSGQSVEKGKTLQFNASVTGTNNPNTAVTWKVSSNTGGTGAVTSGTNTNSSGCLTVSANETAATLYVIATSVADTSKSGRASVNVTAPQQTPAVVEGAGSDEVSVTAKNPKAGNVFTEEDGYYVSKNSGKKYKIIRKHAGGPQLFDWSSYDRNNNSRTLYNGSGKSDKVITITKNAPGKIWLIKVCNMNPTSTGAEWCYFELVEDGEYTITAGWVIYAVFYQAY
jgi:uncharacterized protein YjdB